MRILLDECATNDCAYFWLGTNVNLQGFARLSGLENGDLLTEAELAGFQVMITTDQEIPFQQDFRSRQLSVVILCSPTNRLADLRELVPAALKVLDTIEPGQVVRVS